MLLVHYDKAYSHTSSVAVVKLPELVPDPTDSPVLVLKISLSSNTMMWLRKIHFGSEIKMKLAMGLRN